MAQTMATTNSKNKGMNLLGSNPIIRKINRVSESSADHVTVAGISNKCVYFMFTLIIGVIAAFILQGIGSKISLGSMDIKNVTLTASNVSVAGTLVMAVAGILLVVIPIFSFFMRKAAAVFGTVYCFSAGYFFAFMSLMIKDYGAAVGIALILTVAVCTSMFLLYRSGKVIVTNKFRTVVLTLVFANFLCAIALLVCNFIPGLRFITQFAISNSTFSLVCSIIGVVIASLLLLVDFDGISKAVDNELPKEYEWYCAFGLAFSVIWLFMKILEVVLKVMSKSKK